ncbi:MAG: restriction endonuclease, partial [Gemmatimonadota bacterium]|nr:restriction endonuclease [Gemmatimonadota bacterium]
KLMQEHLYTAASLIVSPRSAVETGEYSEMSDITGLKIFASALAGHVAAEAARS